MNAWKGFKVLHHILCLIGYVGIQWLLEECIQRKIKVICNYNDRVSLSPFGIDNEFAGSVSYHLHLYFFLKSSLSPSLSAIYFPKVNHCFTNHRLTHTEGLKWAYLDCKNHKKWLKLGPLKVFLSLFYKNLHVPWARTYVLLFLSGVFNKVT